MEIWKNTDLCSLEGEIWKEIKDYEGLYEISNFGRVKCLPRDIGHCFTNIKIMRLKKGKNGYIIAPLCFNKKYKFKYVHRIVATAFISNIDNKPQVNHKDGERNNNNYENLEWATESENMFHSYKELGRESCVKKGEFNHKNKKILCINNGIIYYSTNEAGKQTNVHPSNVSKVCRGILENCKNIKFKYI
jgi:hypothetical protein